MMEVVTAVGILAAAGIGVLFIGIAAGLVGTSVIAVLWGWFVTPTFGLAVPPLPVLYGLNLMIYWWTYRESGKTYDKPMEAWVAICTGLVARPLLTLGLGWLAHSLATGA